MHCPRCGSNDIELLLTEKPKDNQDYEQYACNNCTLIWDSEDDFGRYPY